MVKRDSTQHTCILVRAAELMAQHTLQGMIDYVKDPIQGTNLAKII